MTDKGRHVRGVLDTNTLILLQRLEDESDELSRELREPVEPVFRETFQDENVASLDVAELPQPSPKWLKAVWGAGGRR